MHIFDQDNCKDCEILYAFSLTKLCYMMTFARFISKCKKQKNINSVLKVNMEDQLILLVMY